MFDTDHSGTLCADEVRRAAALVCCTCLLHCALPPGVLLHRAVLVPLACCAATRIVASADAHRCGHGLRAACCAAAACYGCSLWVHCLSWVQLLRAVKVSRSLLHPSQC